MNRIFAKNSVCKLAATVLFSGAILLTTGCGMGISAGPASTVGGSIGGTAMGGTTPIVGATVKLYATDTSYGSGSLLQEANQQGASSGQDTDGNGFFTFAGGYTCPAGQFAYITLAGGNTGANTVNVNSVLVAALGRCEDIANHTFTVVNELSTIAAAYALGHFSTVTGTGASTVVGIGAPSTNNAVTGAACVANGTTCITTVASGLAHGFLNAANLVNVAGGVAYANLPGDAAAVVPQALINSMGNVLVACVNSSGGAAPGGVSDATSCGNIFAATSVGTTPPVNTFSAMVNLNANPTLNGSTAAVATFFGYATPATTVYSPALSAATGINDYSIAINYPTGLTAANCQGGTCNGIIGPVSGALDINDVYYVGNQSYASGTSIVGANVISLSSNGTAIGATTNSATFKQTLGLSVDALGNGYFVHGSGSGTHTMAHFAMSAGVFSAYADLAAVGGTNLYEVAIDKQNNVWALASIAATSNDLFMAPSSGFASPTAGPTNAAAFTSQGILGLGLIPSGKSVGLSIDPNQNVWGAQNQVVAILQNTGSVAVPTYSTILTPAAPTSATASGIAFAGTPYVAYVAGYSTGPGVQPYTVTLNNAGVGPEVIGATPGTEFNTNFSGVQTSAEADGAGNIWLADTNGQSINIYNPTAGTAYRYKPCLVTAGACGTIFTAGAAVGKPFTVSIDSAGSVWAPSQASGNVVQVIGGAAPTWPLLSLGLIGKP